MAAPTVTTQAASGVQLEQATGNGNITADGGQTVTVRGFQYNTVQAADKEVSESGSFGTGTYTLTLTGLTPGQQYFYRSFATNADGTGYGSWASFTATAPTYNITIDGTDRTDDVLARTLVIEDVINDKQNTCQFSLIDRSGNGAPANSEEIIITLNDGTKIFGGYIVNVFLTSKKQTGVVQYNCSCVDYVWLFDRNLVHKSYEDMTDKAIIEDIVDTYASGSSITTNNVLEGVTIDQISFNYIQPSQALRQIADLTGRNWYIDYDKDIHYFPTTTDSSPFNIDSSSSSYLDFNIIKDASQIKNRVFVRGGTKLSEETTFVEVGDGEKRQFVLPEKPRNVTVEVDTGGGYVTKTLGIKNIDTSGYEWYLNFQEKYIEQDSTETVLGATDKVRVTYKYDIPILVAVEDTSSIIEHGQREFAIFDKQISTTQAARDRASAELTDYGNNIIEGSFVTYTAGFFSGQYINVNLSDYGINDDYIIQKVVSRSLGNNIFQHTVYIASAKTMGIIRFLIELLEANKNLIELDDNEVIDELLTVTDSLLADSLEDSLTIDSSGGYHVWATDSLQSDPEVAKWDLFQWG